MNAAPAIPDVPVLDIRPQCLACNRTSRGALICGPCRGSLPALLDTIAAGHARLDPTPVRGHGGPGAPGFGSRPPLRIAPLNLAHAGHWVVRGGVLPAGLSSPGPDQAGPAPLLLVVARWAERAREDDLIGPLRGPRTVTGECLRLAGVLDALARRWWVGDMLRDLTRAAGALQYALGEDEPGVLLAQCPRSRGDEQVPADDAAVPGCGGQVRARLVGHAASCRRCGHTWRGEATLRELGTSLGGAMLDLPGLARYLDVRVPTLRQWAHRDEWAREVVGRRTLYALTDAQASWWKRRPQVEPEVEVLDLGA